MGQNRIGKEDRGMAAKEQRETQLYYLHRRLRNGLKGAALFNSRQRKATFRLKQSFNRHRCFIFVFVSAIKGNVSIFYILFYLFRNV
jgi:hypothetical protein